MLGGTLACCMCAVGREYFPCNPKAPKHRARSKNRYSIAIEGTCPQQWYTSPQIHKSGTQGGVRHNSILGAPKRAVLLTIGAHWSALYKGETTDLAQCAKCGRQSMLSQLISKVCHKRLKGALPTPFNCGHVRLAAWCCPMSKLTEHKAISGVVHNV